MVSPPYQKANLLEVTHISPLSILRHQLESVRPESSVYLHQTQIPLEHLQNERHSGIRLSKYQKFFQLAKVKNANMLLLCFSPTVPKAAYFGMNCLIIPEKAMAPHSSTLAWKIPWTEAPGRLRSMGSLRVRHH